jgi:hypothetical protein
VTSLAPPQGPGWGGWSNDKAASEFLNNRYMNNTCRIAAGHLGSLLGMQRLNWNFHAHPLSPNGRSALWFITDDNKSTEAETSTALNHFRGTIDENDLFSQLNAILSVGTAVASVTATARSASARTTGVAATSTTTSAGAAGATRSTCARPTGSTCAATGTTRSTSGEAAASTTALGFFR